MVNSAVARGVTGDLKAVTRGQYVRTLADVLSWHEPYVRRLASAEAELIAIKYLTRSPLGSRSVQYLLPEDFDGFRDEMLGRGKSVAYISRILSTARKALNRAHENRLVPQPVKVPEYRTKAHISAAPPKGADLNGDQFLALWNTDLDPHLRIFLVLALNTAARPGALLDLTGAQIDLGRGLIHLNPHGRVQTKKYRPSLPIPKTLSPWLVEASDGPLISYHGRSIREIDTAFKSACRRSGLASGVNPYSIRHMVARRLRRAGVGTEAISVFLGHQAVSVKDVTLTYSPYDREFLAEAIHAVEAFVYELNGKSRVSLVEPPG